MPYTLITTRWGITILTVFMTVFAGPMGAFAALDIVFANRELPSQVCLRDDQGGFACTSISKVDLKSRTVALGDVNGDTHLDAVFANEQQQNQVCLGDGKGGLICSAVSPDVPGGGGVALGDVNGDTYLDAVFGSFRNRVCLGDGNGRFTCDEISPDNGGGSVALGDVNGDTQLDAVFANRVCLGDGAGHFTCHDIGENSFSTIAVALGDVNDDTYLDAVMANYDQPNRVCLGNGSGSFSCQNVSDDPLDALSQSKGVVLGDVNSDTYLDAIFADENQRNRMCLGDGGGGFTCKDVSGDVAPTQAVALGDVNGDMYLDAVFANFAYPNQVCLGDGSGGFTCAHVSGDTFSSFGVALGKLVEAQPQDPAHTVSQGIVAYYSFDVSAEDDGPNNYDADVTESVFYGSGKFGRAVYFTKSGASVIFPNMPRYAASYSLSAWVRVESLEAPNGSASIPGNIVGRFALVRPSGKLRFYFYFDSMQVADNQLRTFDSKTTVPTGQWVHIAATFHGPANTLKLYINGNLDFTYEIVSSGQIRPLFPYYPGVGGDIPQFDLAGVSVLNGSVDEVLLHDRALSPTEIDYLVDPNGRPGASTIHVPLSVRGDFRRSTECGEYEQRACWKCTTHFKWPPWQWGVCKVQSAQCDGDLEFNVMTQVCQCPNGQRINDHNDSSCFTPPSPQIIVDNLPLTVDISGYPSILHLAGLGKQVIITNANYALYSVPNGKDISVDCGRMSAYKEWACGSGRDECSRLSSLSRSCPTESLTCTSVAIQDDRSNALNYPLFTLEEWNNLYPGGLKINANWFDISGPPNFPHVSPCTDIYGLSVHRGNEVSSATKGDPVGANINLLDALLVTEHSLPDGLMHREVKIVPNAEIKLEQNVSEAVGGFIILQDGKLKKNIPSSAKPEGSGARTGVGVKTEDNGTQTLYIIVVQPGPNKEGVTARDLAAYLKYLGAVDGINLDNSGSSQLIYNRPDGGLDETMMGDRDQNNRNAYRPVPNFFGIRLP